MYQVLNLPLLYALAPAHSLSAMRGVAQLAQCELPQTPRLTYLLAQQEALQRQMQKHEDVLDKIAAEHHRLRQMGYDVNPYQTGSIESRFQAISQEYDKNMQAISGFTINYGRSDSINKVN